MPGTDFLKMNLGKLFNENIEIVMDFFRKLMISAEISPRESKTRHNNGEQACPKRKFDAFSNIMELAHNICSSQVDRNGNLNSKTKGWNGKLIE